MIVQEEYICKNGIEQIHTYSSKGFYILQVETNTKYTDAYDNKPLQYTYIETDEKIEKIEIINEE